MCPEFERVERIVQKMVDKSEKVVSWIEMSGQHFGLTNVIQIVSQPENRRVGVYGNNDA